MSATSHSTLSGSESMGFSSAHLLDDFCGWPSCGLFLFGLARGGREQIWEGVTEVLGRDP